MKTNLLKITAFVRVPEEWDHHKLLELRADPNGYPDPKFRGETKDAPRLPFPPAPIDTAVASSLDELAGKLAAIDPAIELAHEIQR